MRGWFRGLSLRRQLLLVVLGLLLASSLALIFATSIALHTYLVGKLDQQLVAAGNRYSVSLEHSNDHDADNGGFSSVVGQPVGTLGARILNGQVTAAGIIADDSSTQSVSARDQAVIATLPVGGARDVHLPDLGEYRVVVTAGQDGDLQVAGLPKHPVEETIARFMLIEVIVFAVALLLTGIVAAFSIRLTLRPMERISRTARRVTDLPLGRGEVQLPEPLVNEAPGTEIGQLTDAVNRMLQHLQGAFAERQASEDLLRHFVADASHELRTPVAVIGSHAEYIEMTESTLSDSAAEALSRIRAESARMGDLVQDLLLLARLDSGRPLRHASVDLTRILLDAVIDGRALSPDHEWNLDLPEEETVVTGDESSLRQLVVNLIANAVEHTPAGTRITVRLTQEDGCAIATVCDDGPGIAPEFLPHIFERFARGDTSRAHRGGEGGLGLAIVAAIARAHDATVTVTSRPGATLFALTIALRGAVIPYG
ncbi:cell wall metabolism sensor histidine kinase WalK [Jatrophihabitans sp. GAS493]|uniref:sensor histidine kinase n=1 Tax=Jatrophihabitans sp. GAS493 TaxID=1907575 RepID=UPI0018D4F174|nr:HAMP domain-containing sensor histidine kinase [Jatrophihabitans sp. GAS493]